MKKIDSPYGNIASLVDKRILQGNLPPYERSLCVHVFLSFDMLDFLEHSTIRKANLVNSTFFVI